ncbi:hypothetical protein J2W32_004952 [Variovorax boronicumulans]|uniref:Uncharacterized protein n=1 Tax=Variovorax boronicumulans TaxID=436515 RepID=A0AAW8D056_9BURK|nr:hypothetical protein [Variovorax boronicumulans]MDP9895852.1 hypothetical protein [Variovorax boronicumulans]MDQ0055892.1 hypothetical protein [Variovorax boronicumulans]
MNTILASVARRTGLAIVAIALVAASAPALAQQPSTDTGAAAALRAKLQALAPQLERNAFRRPLALESSEAADRLSGDVYALVDHPFARVSGALREPAAWCQVLMLHLNTKHCAVKGGGATLAVAIGRKFDQPLSDAQTIAFAYTPGKADANYLNVRLSADTGPLSTRDYSIVFEATPADGGKTAIHLRYAYAYGTAARLAMKGYLATLGSDKVGFTPAGQGGYIGGVRGVVERNTMRYYLAIDSYLDAPAAGQLEQRLAAWFDATEQYAKQLHEIEKSDYLTMKRHEFQRMQQPAAS